MKKQREYCCYCGKTISQKEIEGKYRDYCPYCETIYYENPLPVACNIVVNEKREILLVKRKKEPYKDMWCLPIGFAESGEEITEAALRELKEEAGVEGEIIRLIDVDTVDNYFYGSLAIITYEVCLVSGNIKPGDDAIDAQFIPIKNIPPLAWTSNEKAINIYVNLYKDIWAMMDSFKQLFPEVEKIDVISSGVLHEQKEFLSNVLIKLIDSHIDDINEMWIGYILKGIPVLEPYLNLLVGINKSILREVQRWLRKDRDKKRMEDFIDNGRELKRLNILLPDILNAMALSRKSLWIFLVKERILTSPLEIYTTLEINNRIIFFYDRVNYYLSLGYIALQQ